MLLLEYDDGLVSCMPYEIIAMQNDQVYSWTIYIWSVQNSRILGLLKSGLSD